MADRNNNGIDDKYETTYGRRRPGDTTSPSTAGRTQKHGVAKVWEDFLQGPVRGVTNWMGDTTLDLLSLPRKEGRSAGDVLLGMPMRRSTGTRNRPGGGSFGDPSLDGAVESQTLSLLDFLGQAESLADRLGLGQGGGGVDYSDAIANANRNAEINRAHLSGIYNQLRQGLEQDRAGIAENYGGAIDRSAEITERAQQGVQGAANALSAKRANEAAALGLNTAAAAQNATKQQPEDIALKAVADAAGRGENEQRMFNAQQANATTHSNNVQDASRFSEARAQGALDASLADRLAELAQLQAQANAENARAQSGRGESILGLAQWLYGDANDRSQLDYENTLKAAEVAGANAQTTPQFTLEQLMQGQIDSGLNTQDYLSFMKLLAQLND